METHDLTRLLEEHPITRGLSPEHMKFLAGCSANRRVAAGEFLAREGEAAERTLLLRKGRVALEIHCPSRGAVRIGTVEAGELIGWSWLFPPYRWHFDARALEDTLLLDVDGACLRRKCEADHDLGYAFLKRLVETMHKKLERTRMQLLDLYGSPGTTS